MPIIHHLRPKRKPQHACPDTACRVTIISAMRILHITKYAHPEKGGVETFVRDLTNEQVRQGHAVSVLCHRADHLHPTESDRINRITTTRCATLYRTSFAPISPTFPLQLKTVIRQERPDIIHLHLPNPAVLFQFLFPANIPLVIHWHADVSDSTNQLIHTLYPAYRFFEQQCLARASRVLTTSPPYLESSRSLAPWKAKCQIIPLGLDLNRYPEKEYPHPERPLVLGVGRFAYYKGFEFLVQAAKMVKDADFVIAGDGPERKRIMDEARRLGMAGRVRFPGTVSDAELARLYQTATLFCLPSVDRAEAFGVTLLEAMRYELPLISTAIPGSGTGWVNTDGETGLVVPPTDSGELAEAIKTIIGDNEKATAYGQAARKKLEELFTIKQAARSIETVYAQTLSAIS